MASAVYTHVDVHWRNICVHLFQEQKRANIMERGRGRERVHNQTFASKFKTVGKEQVPSFNCFLMIFLFTFFVKMILQNTTKPSINESQ